MSGDTRTHVNLPRQFRTFPLSSLSRPFRPSHSTFPLTVASRLSEHSDIISDVSELSVRHSFSYFLFIIFRPFPNLPSVTSFLIYHLLSSIHFRTFRNVRPSEFSELPIHTYYCCGSLRTNVAFYFPLSIYCGKPFI